MKQTLPVVVISGHKYINFLLTYYTCTTQFICVCVCVCVCACVHACARTCVCMCVCAFFKVQVLNAKT